MRSYLDADAWIIHGMMASARGANLVLLRIHGTAGRERETLHVPSGDCSIQKSKAKRKSAEPCLRDPVHSVDACDKRRQYGKINPILESDR